MERVVICVVPRDLADDLHERLRAHYAERPDVQVVVDRRRAARRGGPRRPPALPLPPFAAPFADRIGFATLAPAAGVAGEDRETGRLSRLAAAGDGAAFEAIYLRYYDRVYVYLARMLADRHEAEDAAQEVFVGALKSLRGQPQAIVSFHAWLFRIARNAAIDRLRRRVPYAYDPHDALHERERSAPFAPEDLFDSDVLRVVERLPLDQQRVLFLRYSADLTQRQAACVLGRTPDAVRMLEARATKRLAAWLAEAGQTSSVRFLSTNPS